MINETLHQEPACDLPDAVLIDTFLKIHAMCSGLGPAELRVVRFGSLEAYDGAVDEDEIATDLFDGNREQTGDLRTITSVTLVLSGDESNPIAAKFERQPDAPKVSFFSHGADSAEERMKRRVEIYTQERAGNPSEAYDLAIQETYKSGIREIQAAALSATPQLLRLISAAHACGLILPKLHDATNPDGAAVRALAEQINALRDVINSQARNNEELRRRLTQEHIERSATLLEENEARITRMKQDLAAREEEILRKAAEKEQEIERLAEALKGREERLDLQTERDARRKLREKIQAAATKMFEKPDLSEQAKASFERVAKACRWTIVGAVVLLAVALFVPPVLELGLEKVLSAEVIWLVWSMRILGGITLAAALIYYVSSLSGWSRQVAAIELRSKQFALDIDRASWLVEMALEYEKEGKALPTAMVESFTRGLFDGGAQGHQSEPPSASLLHLIQNAESLKVGAAGAELTLTGKQIRKADAQASKGA